MVEAPSISLRISASERCWCAFSFSTVTSRCVPLIAWRSARLTSKLQPSRPSPWRWAAMSSRETRRSGAAAQEAVNAGDADVVDAAHRGAHRLGGDRRLFGDGNVAGATGDDRDRAGARLRELQLEDASDRVKLSLREAGGEGLALFGLE